MSWQETESAQLLNPQLGFRRLWIANARTCQQDTYKNSLEKEIAIETMEYFYEHILITVSSTQ